MSSPKALRACGVGLHEVGGHRRLQAPLPRVCGPWSPMSAFALRPTLVFPVQTLAKK